MNARRTRAKYYPSTMDDDSHDGRDHHNTQTFDRIEVTVATRPRQMRRRSTKTTRSSPGNNQNYSTAPQFNECVVQGVKPDPSGPTTAKQATQGGCYDERENVALVTRLPCGHPPVLALQAPPAATHDRRLYAPFWAHGALCAGFLFFLWVFNSPLALMLYVVAALVILCLFDLALRLHDILVMAVFVCMAIVVRYARPGWMREY